MPTVHCAPARALRRCHCVGCGAPVNFGGGVGAAAGPKKIDRGGGLKLAKNSMTYLMDGPLVCCVTSTYLIGCAKHKRCKNIEIRSRKLPKICGFITTKVSPTDADYANSINGKTAGGMNSPLDDGQDEIYASRVLI